MEWLVVNQHTQSCLSALGTLVGDTYTASDNCLDVLKEIYHRLLSEDKVTRTFRRAIHFSEGLQNDIIPLLISTKDNEIVNTVVRILVCLLVPVECLLPLEMMCKSDVGRIVVFELQAFLGKSKSVFGDPRSTRAILDFMKSNIKLEGGQKNSECEAINNCLLVLRNVLHIPEIGMVQKNLQNTIVWNLFVQNIDRILIHLMTNDNKAYWSVATVQLIAVLYKDQHVGTLQKLLHLWFEDSLSESSEDNESNTTPDQRFGSSPVMSSEPTSDSEASAKANGNLESSTGVPHLVARPSQVGSTHECATGCGKMLDFEGPVMVGEKLTNKRIHACIGTEWRTADDSSSGHGSGTSKLSSCQHHRTPKRSKASPMSELANYTEFPAAQEFSDCGYASHVETPETVSTSSNEEETPAQRPLHQKPHIQKTRYCNKQPSTQEKKAIKRKKLIQRSRNILMNLKALTSHAPRFEDITDVLKEFTVSFMLTGYEPLVSALLTELLTPTSGLPIDTSHFFWLLTYFLKFATQLELEVDQVRGVFSYEVLSYLVYEGVSISEHVERTFHIDPDVKSSLRRQHLVVTAIREFILALESFDKATYLSLQEKQELHELQDWMYSSSDLKCVMVLMLRLYRPDVHSRQYLEDLVVTNHIMLTFLERRKDTFHGVPNANAGSEKFSIADHLKQFASVNVMKHYGMLLEDFQSNGEYINDCIFTMMHHIGGEIDQIASLCQPNILKTFTQIWESDFQLCEDWSDLIEYVIHRFINIPRPCPFVTSTGKLLFSHLAEDSGWSKEESENLSGYFAISAPGSDLIKNILKLYEDNGVIKTRVAVIERLHEQGVVCDDQYKQLIHAETQHVPSKMPPSAAANGDSRVPDEITSLRDKLLVDGLGEHLSWLQKFLLDIRHAKMVLQQNLSEQHKQECEPIPYYFSMLNQSIPVVSWNCELAVALKNKTFQCLLRQLGFHLPSETGKLFYRIPSFWTADVLLAVARKLGAVDPAMLHRFGELAEEVGVFTMEEEPVDAHDQQFAIPRAKISGTLINYTPTPNVPTSWLDLVRKSKAATTLGLRDLDDPGHVELEEGAEGRGCVKGSVDTEDLECASVLSVCDTQASDLTRMCISDEDDVAHPLPGLAYHPPHRCQKPDFVGPAHEMVEDGT